MPVLDMEHIGRADPQDKPLDFLSTCSAQRCHVPIHFGDEAVQDEDGDLYCSETCYIRATGGNRVYAGMEELV